MREFEETRAGFSFGPAFVVLLGALVVACGFFFILTAELIRSQANDRTRLVEATDAFTSTFAAERNDHNVVPASFRRLGIENLAEFVESRQESQEISVTMRMPGTPGLELRTVENDPRVRAAIKQIADDGDHSVIEENLIEKGRFVGRTIFPSVASNPDCVSCHNVELGGPKYELGDVMGAYVVESDLTSVTYNNLAYAVSAGVLAFLGGGLVARRERRRMNRVVTSLEGQVRAERDKREAEAFANFLSSHDALTGLSNRTMFRDRLDVEVEACSSGQSEDVFVALIDLDDFKSVNDTMGHDAGDALLAEVGQRLSSLVHEETGLVARFGGDEFAVLLRMGGELTHPDQLGEEIVQSMAAPLSHEGLSIQSRCSVGVAALGDITGGDASAFLKAADTALYAAKRAGKGRYRIFDRELKDSMWKRAALSSALPIAIENGEIYPVFQPQIDLGSGQIHGFEALARWNWYDLVISPDQFIPVAEENGLVRQIDLEILRGAASFAVELGRRSARPVRISTNMSALTFKGAGLAEDILDILFETGLPGEQLTLEVTETVLMENWGDVHDVLEVLRAKGVRAALDDFGTGYSSLSYLRQLQFEEIKIDRSFVVDLGLDEQTRCLFAGVIDLAIGLGKTIVVEGVETEEQACFVIEQGAHLAQGFLYSEPLSPADAATAFIEGSLQGAREDHEMHQRV
ncbi:EAL domain-containing protein [Roseibium polysiphoniae]|uniref:EAL domain-containing protein n=1 Tax=Roseibium polysiphoniae TaxID=2571221 RepID=A0A944C8K0_9HYPH|nr:EAL domain-containing protein [Roseibium polysiphoniae]MBS8258869.1 EAL domain-containing protein [Roseibium polysiphoniae]